jgi:lipoprotein-anchoring transpeptidase ErfK/SrfK
MTSPVFSSRVKFIILLILAALVCVFVAAARNTHIPFTAELLEAVPTSTHAPFYNRVELVKPTYTFTPTTVPTSSPTPFVELSATVESLANVEIVPDELSLDGILHEQPQDADPVYNGNKYILVDISEQQMYVYEGDTVLYSFVASTGMNNATRVGSFSVLDKIPTAYGATWDLWMPNWLGIYWSGSLENGIHALPILSNGTQLWAGYLGTPISFGCVVLGVNESQLLYDWVDVGTPVDIQW